MAIKVNGTTVVNDSRSLTNIASIDATTEAAISAAGFSQSTGDITNVTAGGGLTGGGASGAITLYHADTSSQGSINNSGNTVIQDISVDTYGHITSMSSATISTSPPTTINTVGTYAFCVQVSGTQATTGGTTAGSNLRYTHAENGSGSGTPSGTWRLMGFIQGLGNNSKTLWVRTS